MSPQPPLASAQLCLAYVTSNNNRDWHAAATASGLGLAVLSSRDKQPTNRDWHAQLAVAVACELSPFRLP